MGGNDRDLIVILQMNVEAECLKAGVKPSSCCENKQRQVYGVQPAVQRSPALCTKKCTLRILSITQNSNPMCGVRGSLCFKRVFLNCREVFSKNLLLLSSGRWRSCELLTESKLMDGKGLPSRSHRKLMEAGLAVSSGSSQSVAQRRGCTGLSLSLQLRCGVLCFCFTL